MAKLPQVDVLEREGAAIYIEFYLAALYFLPLVTGGAMMEVDFVH